ncbi:hypothetical protein B9Q03_07505 [Candidatus Marsarchaeota G2 archaeon OSP_D]|uniref:Amino acid permease/ SLC12A domain-containing protein n=4 Tax=Candidatus Marsarchaeota group 2 TaxID=2203771 RepID=A0A2R6B9N5_9ARCH|nr:MAG: hypothetical protein B9Q03_07505 [Candidatus Marsarchaeota G2 archaeon OSP_D]PSN95383.1 MAG: hypothetical protein B9Q06_05760 [Candidatus Marsarchaeota G2 archaeon ECH_B_2]PSN98308.1 MAG: hypothetical protein B9Q07_10200 [Candidatus Marsarchaeota G2 archaeon ECH_B_3]PSN99995.1 MAG: hypothetical protein B9Q05_10970 [Candidatus Marsarchaeota G2 archaeon ECH_B_1]
MQIFLEFFGVAVRGYYFLPIPLILIFIIPYFGIKLSSWFYVGTAALEMGIVFVLALLMLGHPAPSSSLLAPFTPTVGISSFTLSVIFSLFFFTGYGSILTLAEETRSPKSSIPKMAVLSILGIGALELLFIYASQLNWGTSSTSSFASSSIFPTYLAAKTLLGVAGLVTLGVVAYISLVKGNIAIQNAASRGLYALGRDNILPPIFSKVHPKYRSPSGAIIANELMALVIIAATYLTFYFGLGIHSGITGDAAVYLIALLTVGYLLTHVLANVSVPFYFTRKERRSLSITKHYILPLASTAATIFALTLSFTGLTGYMASLPVIVAAYLILVLILVLRIRFKHPDIIAKAGRVIPDLEP